MDIHSAFQLSNYCEDIGMHEEGLILLKYSAMRYHPQAPLALAALALQKQNTQEALYWYSRCETTRTSKQLILRVAMLLLDFGTYEAFIAENLLIQLVPSGMSEALYYLGYLHMKHPGDFIGSDSLVIEYFTQAANNGNLQAMDTLGKCYLNGICVEKDVEKGTELLKKAGELAMKLIQENHEENENDEEIEEEEVPEKISKAKELLIDTSISLGIAAAVGFGTVFLFRKFFGK
ncbi:tetratricopeptide repeat domain domain-containing protein [Trichomonas vaginalis G3]|nr:tetratricopeptide repeat domain domain-containing protein [Trichomonas vaginalis G3]KAI5524254.1 tetratricopeptide repeat domain domain-containing protein [Trichomonas vaginalis G3]